jgi:quercetin dioxygenase-like cupin family protein
MTDLTLKTPEFTHGDMDKEKALQQAKEELQRVPEGSTREMLYKLQAALYEGDEVDCPLQHTFAPGAYARTIFIPAGTFVVGKIHKHPHLNILSQGKVTVVTEEGGRETLEGPLTMVSPPGTKRGVYTHTDTTWTTVHLTDHKDLKEIEQEVIAGSYDEYDKFLQEEKQRKLFQEGMV